MRSLINQTRYLYFLDDLRQLSKVKNKKQASKENINWDDCYAARVFIRHQSTINFYFVKIFRKKKERAILSLLAHAEQNYPQIIGMGLNLSTVAWWKNNRRELILRNYTSSTTQTYTSCLKCIIFKIGETPSIDQIKDYLITIKNYSYHKQMTGTIHRYFEFVLKQKLDLSDIPYPRREYKLPEILSVQEIQLIFDKCKNTKHRAIISLLYGCGLRISEVLNVKIVDIDSSRMVINIKQAKGLKDRQAILDIPLLKLLRDYFKEFRPKQFLFNGQFGLQYTASSINQMLKYYADKAGIKKRIHAHKLRHCFGTHLLEQGTDMSLIQKLLGHKHVETTQIYAQINTALLSKIQSPLAAIRL